MSAKVRVRVRVGIPGHKFVHRELQCTSEPVHRMSVGPVRDGYDYGLGKQLVTTRNRNRMVRVTMVTITGWVNSS